MARLYPSQPVVGVGCLVLRGGRILLVKRRYSPGRGKWSIPGGHVRLGETLEEAAVRELEEETGVKGRPLGVVNVDDAITLDEKGVRYHYVLVTVLLEDLGGEPRAGDDAEEAGFYTFDEALRLDLTPSTRGLIEKITGGMICLEKPIKPRRYSPAD
ncbi:NUDIX hydrolase [Aeropyrum camini]|uniref:ADP-ribose pyrophosphatase n=1 Tax=Aeropyrum camini SY1 = JCM 12091 TaxID=1198449 RepID=U3TFF4_9CREN|nr:NUDIX hydrolase [Aeropyrum camini]BAN90770.1 ADP-ribose pyrophosphatase [Aeropyrum camini SY1 = JCM 12091]